MTVNPIVLQITSELLVNLAAGWFGVALILPIFAGQMRRVNFGYLTVDLLFGIVSLVIAFVLRKETGLQ